MADIYLYLARRDKTDIRLLAKFKGRELLPTRLDDLEDLDLPITWVSQLNKIIFESRMLWELWVESSDSFELLRNGLKKRGYINVPTSSQTEFREGNVSSPTINTSRLPKKKIMIKKGN